MLFDLVAAGIARNTAVQIMNLVDSGLDIMTVLSILGGATVGFGAAFKILQKSAGKAMGKQLIAR